jgi:predicted lipoprotein with Yx(FWY)xxD motif
MHRSRALVGALVLALVVAGCADEEPTAPTTTAAVAPDEATDTTTGAWAPATALAPPVVGLDTTSLGEVLVDADGLTLYVFLDDPADTSTCVDACASTWSPLTASSVVVGAGLDEADFTLVMRPDGTSQLAVAGRPLYRFAGDLESGDTTGQGFNERWWVVGADGTPVEAS